MSYDPKLEEELRLKHRETPAGKLLWSMGMDWWDTESSARRVAEHAADRIAELEARLEVYETPKAPKNPPREADPVLLANQYRPWPPIPEGFDEWEYMGIGWRCDSGPAVTYANRGINDFCPEWCIREDAWPEGMGVYLKAVKKHKP